MADYWKNDQNNNIRSEMMKKVSLICFFLLFSMSWVFSQTVEKTTTLYPSQGIITQVNTNDYYDGNYWSLGADTTNGNTYVYRSYYVFDLSAFEDSAAITQVTVTYWMSGGGVLIHLEMEKR